MTVVIINFLGFFRGKLFRGKSRHERPMKNGGNWRIFWNFLHSPEFLDGWSHAEVAWSRFFNFEEYLEFLVFDHRRGCQTMSRGSFMIDPNKKI